MVQKAGKHHKRQYHGTKKREGLAKVNPPRDQSFKEGISITFDVAQHNHRTKKRDHVIRRQESRFPDGQGEQLAAHFWANCHEKHMRDYYAVAEDSNEPVYV